MGIINASLVVVRVSGAVFGCLTAVATRAYRYAKPRGALSSTTALMNSETVMKLSPRTRIKLFDIQSLE